MLTESRAYELAVAAKARIINGKLMVKKTISSELLEEVRANKSELMEYLSGYCFASQISPLVTPPKTWVVYKGSNIGCVSYPPIEIYRGTAHEVDVWCKRNSRDPLFTDKYTSRYFIIYLADRKEGE